MKTPIELELVGKEGDMYALTYPGLQIPIHVNRELLEKFRKSPDYQVRDVHSFANAYPEASSKKPGMQKQMQV